MESMLLPFRHLSSTSIQVLVILGHNDHFSNSFPPVTVNVTFELDLGSVIHRTSFPTD